MAHPGQLASALLWCGGAVEPELLEDLPTERTRYISLALAMFVPVVAGFAGMWSAARSIHAGLPIAASVGCAWAVTIFVIDRALVVSFRRAPSPPGFSFVRFVGSAAAHFALFAVRAGIALFVGAIVSHSLLGLIFQTETTERLVAEREARLAKVSAPFETALGALRTADADQLRRLDEVRAERRRTEDLRNRETAGVGLSTRYGRGPVREDLTDTMRDLDTEIGVLDKDFRARHKEATDAMTRIANERAAARSLASDSQSRGYMARARALAALSAESPELRRDWLVLFGFFVVLELVPLLVKTLLIAGPYAKRVALKEWLAEEASRIDYAAVEEARPERIEVRRIKILNDSFDNAGFGTVSNESAAAAAGADLT